MHLPTEVTHAPGYIRPPKDTRGPRCLASLRHAALRFQYAVRAVPPTTKQLRYLAEGECHHHPPTSSLTVFLPFLPLPSFSPFLSSSSTSSLCLHPDPSTSRPCAVSLFRWQLTGRVWWAAWVVNLSSPPRSAASPLSQSRELSLRTTSGPPTKKKKKKNHVRHNRRTKKEKEGKRGSSYYAMNATLQFSMKETLLKVLYCECHVFLR